MNTGDNLIPRRRFRQFRTADDRPIELIATTGATRFRIKLELLSDNEYRTRGECGSSGIFP